MDAVNDADAYFFSATAYLNLNQLGEAEASALKADSIDTQHHEPLLQLLLARRTTQRMPLHTFGSIRSSLGTRNIQTA